MYRVVIGPIIVSVPDLNIMFFVQFRTGFKVVARHWVPNRVFKLLDLFICMDLMILLELCSILAMTLLL